MKFTICCTYFKNKFGSSLLKLPENKTRCLLKKRFTDGFIIKSKRGAETEFTFFAKSIKSPVIDDRPNLTGAPEQRDYIAAYFIGNDTVGIESDVVSIVV